jgi:antirestriction protein ArdC
LFNNKFQEQEMASQAEIRQQITNQIIDALKRGVAPWRQPWVNDANAGLPSNVISKKRYQGVNAILLGLMSMDQEYQSRHWGTFRQWKALGGSVRRGEMGMRIVFYKPLKRQQMKADGSTENVNIPLMKTFCVFNSEQTTLDGFQVQNDHEPPSYCSDAFGEAETLIASTNADIRFGGNEACYYPQGDFIQMPHKSSFTTDSGFYEVMFHELAHWSEKRLGWEDSYAMGELVAEMSACFVAKELRIPQSGDFLDQHTSYLATWLTKLESDPRFIFRASTQASKATDFLLSFRNQTAIVPEYDEVPF